MSAPGGANEPRTKPSRVVDVLEAALWVALVVLGVRVAFEVIRHETVGTRESEPGPGAIPGLVEAEELGRHQSRPFGFWLQPAESPGGWSQGAHMFATGTEPGDWVDLELPRVEPGRYQLEVFLTRAADYGIVALSLDGARRSQVDLWTPRGVYATGPLALGEVELGERARVLRVAVVGANRNSAPPRFQFGIDGVRLTPVAP